MTVFNTWLDKSINALREGAKSLKFYNMHMILTPMGSNWWFRVSHKKYLLVVLMTLLLNLDVFSAG